MARKHSNFRFLRRHRTSIAMMSVFAAVPVGLWLGDGTKAIAESIVDPLALLSLRSPGERADGALFASKPAKVALAAPRPTERVLSMVRQRPTEPPVSIPEAPLTFSSEPVDLTVGSVPLVPVLNNPTIDPGIVPQLCCNVQAVPEVPGAVPEPETWLMMLIGFFATGGAMRRRRPLAPAGRLDEKIGAAA